MKLNTLQGMKGIRILRYRYIIHFSLIKLNRHWEIVAGLRIKLIKAFLNIKYTSNYRKSIILKKNCPVLKTTAYAWDSM